MAFIRENGVHRDDKDKQWSGALRDFAIVMMKLTFKISSADQKKKRESEDKFMQVYKK